MPTRTSEKVSLQLPASGAFVSLLRTVAVGLAARLDFTLDEIEDLRIAVSEGCVLLLEYAEPPAALAAEFVLAEASLQIELSVATTEETPLSQDTFAWTVLNALAEDVGSTLRDGILCLHLRKTRVREAE